MVGIESGIDMGREAVTSQMLQDYRGFIADLLASRSLAADDSTIRQVIVRFLDSDSAQIIAQAGEDRYKEVRNHATYTGHDGNEASYLGEMGKSRIIKAETERELRVIVEQI